MREVFEMSRIVIAKCFWNLVGSAAMCLLTGGVLTASAQIVNSNNWSTVQPILARNVSTITSLPQQTPGVNVTGNGLNMPDGPVLGNGHVTAAIGGNAAAQMYTLTTTDFFDTFTPAVVGSVTINTPGFDTNATYQQQQDPGLGEVRSTFTEGSQSLYIRSIVAATANLLILQLTNKGSSTITGVSIATQAGSVGSNDSLPITDGVQTSTGTAWVTRSTAVSGNVYPARPW
jgi:hypothetical protein